MRLNKLEAIKNLSLFYYSPTGTTQKIVREIGQNLGLKLISENNLTENKSESLYNLSDNCLTIIGMPVYSGRLPTTVIEMLKKLRSNQTPVVIVVVYGNRAYEDALLELKEIADNCGFKVIAGATFIGEHSYSTHEQPIAIHRPDEQDLEKCRDFAQMIRGKMKDFKDVNSFSDLKITGNFPYRERKPLPSTIHPETDKELCTLCGVCADVCPADAITIQGAVLTDGELCTLCCACVKYCPEDARFLDHPAVNTIRDNLVLNCYERKEPEFFI